ncbi:hypothetical protein LguiA_024497 [Lonicera macranthoides]
MRGLGVEHDGFTFPIVNRGVVLVENGITCGEVVHGLAIRMGFKSDLYFCNTMIKVYVKCGYFCSARKLFDEMSQRDLVSWTSIISGCVKKGSDFSAFTLFCEMQMDLEPNSVTMIVMFQLCNTKRNVVQGRQLHGYVIKKGLMMDQSLQNSVMKMYANMGNINDAEIIFGEIDKRDVVSWNIMISSYSARGEITKVADCFRKMQCEVVPSFETLTLLISMSADSGDIFQGEQLHCLVTKTGLCDNILRTSLLDFYAKCGKLESSVHLFNEIPCTNSIAWSAMMSGFVHNGYFKDAVELFQYVLALGIEPSAEILRTLIVTYSHMGALRLGKGIHAHLIRNSFYNSNEDHTALETSILNMYIRCGNISFAKICFDRMVGKDLVTWTSMIEGYGTHGLGIESLDLFDRLVEERIEPNSVTFLSLLSACSHSGLLTEGCKVFHLMKWKFRIEPDLNHYTCVVDLLGRSGKLNMALAIILRMVDYQDSRIWGALLSASRIHNNQKLGEFAAKRILELEPDNAGYYTLLSNVQASGKKWDEVEEVRNVMEEKDLMKQPGWSCIEAQGLIHGFVSGDRSHPQVVEIYEILGCLSSKMQDLENVLSN